MVLRVDRLVAQGRRRLVALGLRRHHRPPHHCCRLLLGDMLNRRPRHPLGRRVGGDSYPRTGDHCFHVLCT